MYNEIKKNKIIMKTFNKRSERLEIEDIFERNKRRPK